VHVPGPVDRLDGRRRRRRLRQHVGGAGTVLAAFTLGAKGFQHIDLSDGVRCNNGIYLTASAAVTGNVRIG
jgi:hypothetical protein